jgi:cell division protein ZapD
VLLGLLRDSGSPQRMMALAGQYQQSLPAGKTYHLMRVRVASDSGVVPEITGHRLMVSIRFMKPDAEGRLRNAGVDTAFDLALCG